MINWIKKWWATRKLQRDCEHEWYPIGYVDCQCSKCAALTDGWPDRI